jgi:lipopolysaccharide biosynthesis glycosyltransferase/glycosyltransferase involved in cell wall biosynthesis
VIISTLKQANEALRSNQCEAAIRLYISALQENPTLAHLVHPNLKLAQARYLKARANSKQPRVLVSCWNLAENAAGRAATLAQLYQPLAEVGIIGCTFNKWGHETWAPIRNSGVNIQNIQIKDESQFINQALELVLQNPCDLLHLAKPRMPNIIIGALYKHIWSSHVILDIDDEELAFVGASDPLTIADYLRTNSNLPELRDLPGETWTRLAVGLTNAFDGITVVNPALQQRYGGKIVRHARDEKQFAPSAQRRQQSRNKLGIPQEEKVVLFLGTPRQHKGLLETAQAIASLKRKDVLYLIVGDFPHPNEALKADIAAIPGLKTQFLGDQPFEAIPDILAAADLCVLLQDPQSAAAQYQTPAKLTDAMAMGLPVLAEKTPGLADLADKGAFQVVDQSQLANALANTLKQPSQDPKPHPIFLDLLTTAANRSVLAEHIKSAQTQATPPQATLKTLINHLCLPTALNPSARQTKTIVTDNKHTTAQTAKGQNTPQPVEDVIRAAELAMTQDDWSGAYEHWKSLLNRPHGELSIDLLLRISRELFKLDAFPEAASALNKAANLNPNHPGVLCEQAQQYYYHCYSSWLMLVTENEPDWYKADGLETRPDWQTACQLIEKAEKAAPRNNVRRYVQAYLLLAEEAWGKQNRKDAHAALGTALQAIGPNKLNKALTQAIYTAIDQFRAGQANEKDPYFQTLQDHIKTLPLDMLSVPDWLCLNDILNWNGLLLCGFVAREKAVDLAIAQGRAEGANKESLKTALKAALDKNDTALADDFLGKLKQISPDVIDVEELDACCELMKGNLDAFRLKWPYPPKQADKRLRDYLKDKTVAVIGPAPSLISDRWEDGNCDVIAEINWRVDSTLPVIENNIPVRTNISLYNAHSLRKIIRLGSANPIRYLNFIMLRRPNFQIDGTCNSLYNIVEVQEPSCGMYKSNNSVQAAVLNLLKNYAEKLIVKNITLYTGTAHHKAGYRKEALQGVTGLRSLQPVFANHDLVGQFYLLRKLVNNGSVRVGEALHKLLCLNAGDYLKLLHASPPESLKILPKTELKKVRGNKYPASYNYYQFNNLIKGLNAHDVCEYLGNHGSKLKKSLEYQKSWPFFETTREPSVPGNDVAFLTIATPKFLPGLEALILGLLKLYPAMECDFYVFHNGTLSDFAKNRLHSIYNHFIFDETNADKYDVKFSNEVNHKRIGALGYLNLEALSLFRYRRVVILDSDLLILNDISALWDNACGRPRVVMDAGIRPFGVVSPYTKKTIFNSGVISLPQDFIRNNTLNQALECIKTLDQCTCEILNGYADQKFWNIFLSKHDVTYLPMNYNANKTYIEIFHNKQLHNVSILHFTSAKPWYFYSSKEYVSEVELAQAKDLNKTHPITFRAWSDSVASLLCRFRKKRYLDFMGGKLDNLRDTFKGGSCLLIGNGPSLSKTNLHSFDVDVKICFNWFVHHDDFDSVKPDHYILPSHQFFGGWHTYDPKFPDGFLAALLSRKHKPTLWISYYFKEYVESIKDLKDYNINYILFEKPNKYHSDHLGWMGVNIYDFLTDNRTGILTVGVPLAVHLGVKEISLVGCDSNYKASKDDYFYSGELHTSKSTDSKSLVATWSDNGPGFECYRIAARTLQGLGTTLRDCTVGGSLNFLNEDNHE